MQRKLYLVDYEENGRDKHQAIESAGIGCLTDSEVVHLIHFYSMNQLRVWNSMCRSFVKCVAIHTGLGFDLWLKEEMQPFSNQVPEEEQKPSAAQVKVLKEVAARHKVNLGYWIRSNNKTWDTLTARDVGQMLSAIREKYGDSEGQ